MKKSFCVTTSILITSCFQFSFSQKTNNLNYATRMWYDKPAINFNAALPMGNGRMGAMIYGGAASEYISLNEQTLWSGTPTKNWNNPAAQQYLPLVRQAALEGNYKKADSLSKFMQGPYTESYMPMADLFINYKNIPDSANYIRELNLDSAICKTKFTSDKTTFTRSAFASFPDKVIVIRNSANKPASVSFQALLTSKLHYTISKIAENHLVLKGKCPQHVAPVYLWQLKPEEAIQYASDEDGEGMTFEVHLYIKNEGGTVHSDGKSITVEKANAVTFIISAATSFNGFNKSPGLEGKNPSIDAARYLNAAVKKTYIQLLQKHISDYQPIFRRVNLYLGKSENTNLPTDERLKLMNEYTDPELVALISQFGRYLLIASSRPGGQPANLKGIWNEKLRPEYSSNWCLDHDAQMFYYPVETNNLSEMHEPFLKLIEDLAVNGKETARINYGMNGWCAHHNTDIWRPSAPVGNWGEGNPHWATWNMSGPWLCAHLYDHYLFTGDKKFLKEKAWPVMKGAAEFCLKWLIEDQTGKLISVPSVSPENTFITERGDTAQISINTTSDIALIKELFTNCIQTATILKTDLSFANELKTALSKLPGYPIGSKGQLLEWQQEWAAMDPAHRHLSHMYPVYPGSEISPFTTAALSDAAKKALTLREKTNGTWGFAWKAACWSRLGEGDSAWQTLQYQLQFVNPESKSSQNNLGLYPNLFNSEVPAVILNGNACTTAALTEMILQSHTGAIDFLPALPTAFSSGIIKGICTRGGFVIDLEWKDNKPLKAIVYSKLGNKCTVRSKTPVTFFENNKKKTSIADDSIYSFTTEKGHSYTIHFK